MGVPPAPTLARTAGSRAGGAGARVHIAAPSGHFGADLRTTPAPAFAPPPTDLQQRTFELRPPQRFPRSPVQQRRRLRKWRARIRRCTRSPRRCGPFAPAASAAAVPPASSWPAAVGRRWVTRPPHTLTATPRATSTPARGPSASRQHWVHAGGAVQGLQSRSSKGGAEAWARSPKGVSPNTAAGFSLTGLGFFWGDREPDPPGATTSSSAVSNIAGRTHSRRNPSSARLHPAKLLDDPTAQDFCLLSPPSLT